MKRGVKQEHRRGLQLILALFLVVGLGNCSLVFPVLAPFSDLPEPTGPFSVATRLACWTDSSRDETFTPEQDYRKIVVQVWYPSDLEFDSEPLPYIDSPELRLPAIAKQLRLPRSLISHFADVKTHSFPGESTQQLGRKFPAIIFSHGLSGMRFQNTALVEELASHGYVVFAADHSYEANITIFDNGETAEYRAGKRRSLNEDYLKSIDLTQLSIIVEDMQFIMDKMRHPQLEALMTDLPFDTSKIGVMGHSLGGAAVINTLAIDSRVSAAMVLDGWYTPVPDEIVTEGLGKPFYHLGQKGWQDRGNYHRMDQMLSKSTGPSYKMLIPGTMHTDFTDMPLFTPFSLYIGYTSAQDPIWLNTLLREQTLGFFNVYLKDFPIQEFKDQINLVRDVSSYIFDPDTP